VSLNEFGLILALLAFVLSLFGTWLSLSLARRLQIWDDPKSEPSRKKQITVVPLMGATGTVIVATGLNGFTWLANKFDIFGLRQLLEHNLTPFRLAWVFVSLAILLVAGFLDDTGKASNKWRFGLVGLALIISVFLGGLQIPSLSAPFNEFLPNLAFLPQILAFLWLGFCLFTTKVLDGHDGLVASVGIVGFLTIASVSLFPNVYQPLIFVFALVWAFSLIGFLPFNFPHARLYLGEGGSMMIGFMIGVLSILSGAKVATTGTVIGWFIIDLLFVWFLRILDKRNPLTSADRNHWHQRLHDIGLNKYQVLSFTVMVILVSGQLGLQLATQNKVFVLVSQGVFLLLVFGITFYYSQKKRTQKP
jgi:UDP-GlcNAc:undecaprenyl-phosphate/decaprenyl-phosphate GlcNAc-1-phosphate transferase